MKNILIAAALMASLIGAQSVQHEVIVKNCSVGIGVANNCGNAFGVALPIAPDFQPQVQILIIESAAAPPGYQITLSYTDVNGIVLSTVLPLATANIPFPNGTTTTLVTVLINNVTNVIAQVKPVQRLGPTYTTTPLLSRP